jgi:general secretion pathway protein D
MKLIAVLLVFFSLANAQADDKVKVYLNGEEITKVIEMYSKATGQKFIIDPGVRGKISIFNQEPISKEEFFDQMSNGLALNGFAISKQGDVMVVQSARNAQRNLLEVSNQRPSLKPQRMYTWIYRAKYLPVQGINRDLRILPSKDGEMNIHTPNNELIITDWVSNINRVADILERIDVPQDPAAAKLAKQGGAEDARKGAKNDKPRFSPNHPAPEAKGAEKTE